MDECAQMRDLFTSYTPFHIVLTVQVILCLAGGLLCIPVISKVNKSYFHPNCKSLLFSLFVWYLLHSISQGFTMGYHLYSYLSKSGCQVLVSSLFCDIARGPSTMSIIIASILHLFLCVERIAARYYGIEYDKKRVRLGPLLIGISIMYTFLVYGWILSFENFSYQVPFCTPSNKYTDDRSNFVFKFSPILDVTSLVIMIFLTFSKKKSIRSFDLNVNFSISENNSICLMLWPFSVLHLIAQIPFLLMAAYLSSLIPSDSLMLKRTVLQIRYIYPLYIITGCLVLLNIMRKIREQRRNKIHNILRNGNDEGLIHQIYSKDW